MMRVHWWVSAALVLPQIALAADRTATLTGAALSIEHSCAHHASIMPDPALRGTITVTAHAEHPEEVGALLFDSGRIYTAPGTCWQPPGMFSSFQPTMDLQIKVPVGIAISITDGGAPFYEIGAVGGELTLDVSGAVKINAANATSLRIEASGDDALDIRRVSGGVTISESGAPHVTLDEVNASELQAGLSGAASLITSGGRISTVMLEDSGAGRLDIGGAVTDADVTLSGAGQAHFAKLIGHLQKHVSGAASVSAGN